MNITNTLLAIFFLAVLLLAMNYLDAIWTRYQLKKRINSKKSALADTYGLILEEIEKLKCGVLEYDRQLEELEDLIFAFCVYPHEMGVTAKWKQKCRIAGAKATARVLIKDLRSLSHKRENEGLDFATKAMKLACEFEVIGCTLNYFIVPSKEKVLWADINAIWDQGK